MSIAALNRRRYELELEVRELREEVRELRARKSRLKLGQEVDVTAGRPLSETDVDRFFGEDDREARAFDEFFNQADEDLAKTRRFLLG